MYGGPAPVPDASPALAPVAASALIAAQQTVATFPAVGTGETDVKAWNQEPSIGTSSIASPTPDLAAASALKAWNQEPSVGTWCNPMPQHLSDKIAAMYGGPAPVPDASPALAPVAASALIAAQQTVATFPAVG